MSSLWKTYRCALGAALACCALVACEGEHPEVERSELSPLPLVAPEPADNPTSAQKVELGRLLFWDPLLSGDEDVACATCHHPDFGYGDGLDLSRGVGGEGTGPQRMGSTSNLAGRNAPTVLNTGFNGWTAQRRPSPEEAPMFWDSRAKSLEEQALGPIQSGVEMRGEAFPEAEAVDRVVDRLAAIPEYEALFAAAFDVEPSEAVTARHLAMAIAAFERHLSQPNSAYDRWLEGDDEALTARQKRGLDAFHGVGCVDCHAGPMFSDYEPHRLGVQNQDGMPDEGDGEGRFRTPTVRNIALTAPYMHSGVESDLGAVLDFYRDQSRGRSRGGDLDRLLTGLDLRRGDQGDIEAFLGALTDDFDRQVPTSVPSGLPVGGALR